MRYRCVISFGIRNIKCGSNRRALFVWGDSVEKFLYNDIAFQLEKQIRSNAFSEGQKLPSERFLAQQYGVSRNVIREALRTLSERGLVGIRTGKGAYVPMHRDEQIAERLGNAICNSTATLSEILEVREALELTIVEKSAVRSAAEDIRRLKKIYCAMERACSNPEHFVALDERFHIELAHTCGNSMFVLLTNVFYRVTDQKLFRISRLFPERIESAQTEHANIISSIEKHDAEAALENMRIHLRDVREDIEKMNEIVDENS